MQCIYSSVLQGESPENGSFIEFGQRLLGIFAEKVRKWRNWRLLTIRKSPPLAGLSATKEENSLKCGLPGWRRSADRTRLRANSLLTGNLTGKMVVLGSQSRVSMQEGTA